MGLGNTALKHFGSSQLLPELVSWLQAVGLEVYASKQLGVGDRRQGPGQLLRNCTNLHAILRSPRGDGKEAIVLVTPVELSGANPGAEGDSQMAWHFLIPTMRIIFLS